MMIFDRDALLIVFSIGCALLMTIVAYLIGARRKATLGQPDECEWAKAEVSALEKGLARAMMGPMVQNDDLIIILYDLTGLGMESITLSRDKIAQAIACVQAFKSRGILHQVPAALYGQCPQLIGAFKKNQ